MRESLDRLRSEIECADFRRAGERERLEGLVADLERKLERPDDPEHHRKVAHNLREAIQQLEAEHPRAVAVLNKIMMALGGAGI